MTRCSRLHRVVALLHRVVALLQRVVTLLHCVVALLRRVVTLLHCVVALLHRIDALLHRDHGNILLLSPPPPNLVGFWRSRKRLKKFNKLNLASLFLHHVVALLDIYTAFSHYYTASGDLEALCIMRVRSSGSQSMKHILSSILLGIFTT